MQIIGPSSSYNNTVTAASGTADNFASVIIPRQTITATNSNVITNIASSLFIRGSPIAGTNQTINNPYAIHVQSGSTKLAGPLILSQNNASNTVSLLASSSQTSNFSLTLPTATPTSTQALLSDVNGNLSWGSVSSAATQSTFSAANNITSPAPVNGLSVSTSPMTIPVYVSLLAAANFFAVITLQIYYNNTLSSYILESTFVGDDTQVRFDVTSTGQIVYYSGNYAGFSSLTFSWFAPFTPVASVTSSLSLSSTLNVNGFTTLNGGLAASNWFPFRNKVHNGHMQIDQRGIGPYTAADQVLNLDRWRTYNSLTSNVPVIIQTVLGASNSPPLIPNTGFTNALLWTNNATATTDTTVFNQINHQIEAQDIQNFQWGKSTAVSCTISFYAYSSVAGTFALAFRYSPVNSTSYYVTTYNIATALTWQFITITVPPLTAATVVTGTNPGLSLTWTIHGSSPSTNFGVTSVLNSWQSGNLSMVSNQTQMCATSNSQWAVTGIQLELGSNVTPFEWRPAQVELSLCRRYLYCLGPYNNGYTYMIHGVATTTSVWIGQVKPEVQMRIVPTIGFAGSSWALDTYAVNSVVVSTGNITVTNSTNGFFNVLVSSSGLVQFRPYHLTTTSTGLAVIWFYADF